MKLTIKQAIQKGIDAYKEKRFKEAEKIYHTILKVDATNVPTYNNLAVMLFQLDRFNEAEICYKKLLTFNPKYVEAYSNLGTIQYKLGKLEDSETSYLKAIKLNPDYIIAHNNLGNTLKKLGRINEAEKSYKKAIEIKPDYIEAYYNLSVLLQEANKLEEAEINCKKAIELNPKYAEVYNNKGITLQKLGRLKEAEVNFEKAIEFKSNYVEAYFNLSQIKNFNKEDNYFIQLENLYIDKNFTDEQRCNLSFALAKVSEDLNKYEISFEYYCKGNALRKKTLLYNINQDIALFSKLKKSYPIIKKNSIKENNSLNDPQLIFILGMPRSGSTLVEQIVSSHPNVIGGGELSYVEEFGHDVASGKSKINTKTLKEFKKNYLKKIKGLSSGNFVVTDKMTTNFRYIGLICSVFPAAKIVNVRRNSAATCWGSYSKLFSNKKSFPFCYDLRDLVAYYELYESIMQFWNQEIKDRIYTLNYETLTTSQVDETRKLLKYLELNWDDNCLSPQYNKRSVSTASSKQIRQKIYQGSSQKWKKFEPYLDGVFNEFKDR